MTDRELILLHDLLEDLETDEGVCYKTRSSTCATACPLWYAGAFGDNICPRSQGNTADPGQAAA